MSSANDKSRVVSALDCLRLHNHYFEFDDQERVVKVAVYRSANTDEIAQHVGQLSDLRMLRFSRTDLTDRGLAHLSDLVHLRELEIGGNSITATGLKHLSRMSRLDDLCFENAQHFDHAAFEAIARVQSLRKLSVYRGSYHDADLAPLASLIHLEELLLSENKNLDGTYCAHLAELPLRYLSPGKQLTDEGLTSIARLSTLETLFLAGPFSDAGLRQIHTLERLQTLYITSQRITLDGLEVVAGLPRLDQLGLRITPLTDECVPILARCPSLTSLTLFCSNLTDTGRNKLHAVLPDCEINDFSLKRADRQDSV